MDNHVGFLNDTWSFYFHDPYDSDWTYDSYKKICDMGSVNDYWNIDDALQDSIAKGMFFIMREHIFPCWDDEYNIEGGCLSMKVLKQDMVAFWRELSSRLLGETMLKDEHIKCWNMVNGLSTSPKKHFSIVKIWVADVQLADFNVFNIPKKYYGEIIFKSNKDNITNDHISNNKPSAIKS
jgi:hypothetical protein